MIQKRLKPVHPGEILQYEFIVPMGLNQNKLAQALSVPARRINEIVLGKRSITADTALRLSKFFNNSAHFWMGLQMDFELDTAQDKLDEKIIDQIKPFSAVG